MTLSESPYPEPGRRGARRLKCQGSYLSGGSQFLLALESVDNAHSCDQERDQHQCDDDGRPNPTSLAPAAPSAVQESSAELPLPKGMQFQHLTVGMGRGW